MIYHTFSIEKAVLRTGRGIYRTVLVTEGQNDKQKDEGLKQDLSPESTRVMTCTSLLIYVMFATYGSRHHGSIEM